MENLSQLQPLVVWASIVSLITLVATLAAVPAVVSRLPADYFCRPTRATWRSSARRPAIALTLVVFKNGGGAL